MEVKKQRLKILQNRWLVQSSRYSAAMVGSTQRVLIIGPSKKNPEHWAGRTECNRVINFDGPRGLRGTFVDIHVTEALPNSLRGRLITETETHEEPAHA